MAEATNKSDVTVYGYSFTNLAEGCNTNLSLSMWASTIKLAISDPVTTGDKITYDRDNAQAIYLNHTKAKILAELLKEVITTNPKNYNRGIQSSQNIIIVSSGELINMPGNPCVIIESVSPQGQVESSKYYVFKNNYNFIIDNFDAKTCKFDKDYEFCKNVEIEELILALEEYARAMTGAIAFTVANQMKYNINRILGNQNKIATKLGVDLGEKPVYNGSRSSFFNNSDGSGEPSPSSFKRGSIDDLA